MKPIVRIAVLFCLGFFFCPSPRVLFSAEGEKEALIKSLIDAREDWIQNAVFCGHLHRNAYGRYKDVEVVTSNAVGMDLTGEDRHGMTLIEVAPSGYSHKYMTFEEF